MLVQEMVVRYAAEMASLEEGIAQANAAVESMAPVAAEMAASVDASFATMDEAVSNLVPALVDADGNIVALDASVASLSPDLEAAYFAIARFADAADTASVSTATLDTSMASVDASCASVATSADAASGSIASIAPSADSASVALDILAGAADAADAGITALGDAALAVIGTLALVAAVLGVIGLAIAGVSAKLAGDFQAGLTSLVTGAGEAASNIKMVGDGILALAPKVGQTTGSLIAGMYMIESSGQRGAQALNTLQMAAEGAKVGEAQLGDVANGVTTIMTDYASAHISAAAATNTLIAEVKLGKSHMQDMATAMATILPTSSSVGVSLTDTAGAMATMTAEGTDAASAATYLKQMLLALEAPTKQGAAALREIGLSTQQVADEMRVSLPGTLQMITDALAKKFPVGSAAYIAALKEISGGSRQMQGMLELTGQHLSVFADTVKGVSDAVKKGGNAVLGWADVQADFNQKMAQAGAALEVVGIKLGTLLLPYLSQLMDKINPVITAFGNWVTSSKGLAGMLQNISGLVGQIGAAFNVVYTPIKYVTGVVKEVNDAFDRTRTGLAVINQVLGPVNDAFDRTGTGLAVINQALAPVRDAFDRTATGLSNVNAAAAPLHDVFDRTSTGLANITHSAEKAKNPFVEFFYTVRQVTDFISKIDWGTVFKTAATWIDNAKTAIQNVWAVISKVDWGGIWNNLVTAAKNVQDTIVKLQPAFKQMRDFMTSQFLPVWKQLQDSWNKIVAAIQPLMPQIKQFGELLGGLLAIILAVAVGLATGLARAIGGISQIIAGIGELFSGLAQTLSGITQFISDLITGKFDKLGADLASIWDGIKRMFLGVWDIIAGTFNTFIGLIEGFIDGFCATISAIFQGLSDTLVGHSIIPDMINSIISWFAQLPGRAMGAIQALPGQLAGFFSGIASQAVSWGANIIQGVINGINSMFGAAGTAMGNFTSWLGSFLPHSPAKQGELSHLNEYGPSLVKGISQGITASQPLLQASLDLLMRPVGQAMHVAPASGTAPVAASSGSGGKRETHIHVHVGSHEVAHAIADDVAEIVVDRMRFHGVKAA